MKREEEQGVSDTLAVKREQGVSETLAVKREEEQGVSDNHGYEERRRTWCK